MLNFGNRLKQLRISKKLTQQDLAKLMGLSRATIAGYEASGKQPDQEKTLWLADYFQVSTDYLLGRTDSPTPPSTQDPADEHNYDQELKDFINDRELNHYFSDYGAWTEEEKKNLLNYLMGQDALRKLKNIEDD